ncbi:MAG TPA: formate dehydrogenase accessory sulfurtransferase FdhD [Thermoanaerobaculia bacterium]|nr:formate dehydrogenase accessory sulfurtransferase FdhD [Thermoanaerobaculia bacterium]
MSTQPGAISADDKQGLPRLATGKAIVERGERGVPQPAAGTAAAAAVRAPVVTYDAGRIERRSDALAAEEPLEMRVTAEEGGHRVRHAVAVTMRTPGHDFELTAGFMLSEGILASREAVWSISYCRQEATAEEPNVVEVHLAPEVPFDPRRFSRNVYTTSSCGVCGKTSIDMVRAVCPARPVGRERIAPGVLTGLPETLRRAQPVFSRTGGLHAAGLFDAAGRLLLLHEDVGRHNAVDKLIGTLLLDGALPASDRVLLVSGRASFELVQKAAAGGIPVLAAVGAPSSLAVELAREQGMTLVGFLRGERFNVYSGEERIL